MVQQTCWSKLMTYSSLVPLPPALQGVYLWSAGGNWKADGIPFVSEAEVRVSVWLRGLPLSGRGRRLSCHPPAPLPLSSAKQTSAAAARSHPPQNLSILSLRFRAGCLKWTELSPIWLTCSPSGSPMRAGHFTCFRLEKNHNRLTCRVTGVRMHALTLLKTDGDHALSDRKEKSASEEGCLDWLWRPCQRVDRTRLLPVVRQRGSCSVHVLTPNYVVNAEVKPRLGKSNICWFYRVLDSYITLQMVHIQSQSKV